MKGILKELTAKLYSFFYFMFWGFYFSAGYFFYKYMYFLSGEICILVILSISKFYKNDYFIYLYKI